MKVSTAAAGVGLCLAAFCAGRFSVQTESKQESTAPTSAKVLLPAATPSVAEPSRPSHPAPPGGAVDAGIRWNDASWQELISQPGTLARNQRLASLLEHLALTDPQRALSLAMAEKNLKLRDQLRDAALRGWARVAPDDAADRALAFTDDSARESAIAAVFSGVAGRPEEALRLGRNICAGHPGEATGYGNALIDALCDAGNFSTAIQLVSSSDGEVQRSIWTAEAYSRWAALQPDQAAEAAAALTDPSARTAALHGVVGGWAQADPAGLTHFLAEQPAGGDRGPMIGQALQSWVRLDPEGAAAWINDRDASPDYDEGVAAVANVSFVKISVALGWAETIANPALRSETIADVLHNWVLEDPPAAKQYFASTTNLLPEDRRKIGEIIATGESPTSQLPAAGSPVPVGGGADSSIDSLISRSSTSKINVESGGTPPVETSP